MNTLFKKFIPKAIIFRNASKESGVNQVNLIGRIGKIENLTLTNTTSNLEKERKLIKFSLATNSYYSDETQWHNICVFSEKLQNLIDKTRISKGDKMFVTGRIQYKVDKNTNNSMTYIIAEEIVRLSIAKNNLEAQ